MSRRLGAPSRRPTRILLGIAALAALICALAVLVVVVGGRSSTSAKPSSSATLVANLDSSSRCPSVPLASVLDRSDLAVSGTVLKVTDRGVVLQIDHVYRGDPELVTLTVRRGARVAGSLRVSSVWTRGQRQLLAASGGVVIECVGGATVPWNQETAEEYQRTLG